MTDEHRTRERPRDETADEDAPPAGRAGEDGSASVERPTVGAEDARGRRWLVGGAVLGGVVVLAFVLGSTLAAEQARDRARADALRAAAEASFATVVVERAESYEVPALEVRRTAPLLRAALEEHLVGTGTVDASLTDTVEQRSAALLAASDRIEGLTTRPLPTADPLVDPDTATEVVVALEQLRVESDALVEEIRTAVTPAVAWSTAVVDLDAALVAHASVVEQRADDSDPSVIADGWRAELAPLQALLDQARATAAVPGLAAWADAHAMYAEGTIDFVERAVPLLERGELDEYNRLFLATFGTDDPFGFQDAARAGAVAALADDPIVAVARLEERATFVLDSLTAVEQLLADRFATVR